MTVQTGTLADVGDWFENACRHKDRLPPCPNSVSPEHVRIVQTTSFYNVLNDDRTFTAELAELYEHWNDGSARSFAGRYQVPYHDLTWSYDLWRRSSRSGARLYVGYRRYPALKDTRFPPVLRNPAIRRRMAMRLDRRLQGWSWPKIAKAEGKQFAPGLVTEAPDLRSVKRSVRALAGKLGMLLPGG